MLEAILTTAIIVGALGWAMSSRRRGDLISEHRYNNLYNDAPGARADHLG
jgi:hypothetical protein